MKSDYGTLRADITAIVTSKTPNEAFDKLLEFIEPYNFNTCFLGRVMPELYLANGDSLIFISQSYRLSGSVSIKKRLMLILTLML